jgi:hypothetical protein
MFFQEGDVVGLLLDCDAGTLAVKNNGARLGVAVTGLAGSSAGRRPSIVTRGSMRRRSLEQFGSRRRIWARSEQK